MKTLTMLTRGLQSLVQHKRRASARRSRATRVSVCCGAPNDPDRRSALCTAATNAATMQPTVKHSSKIVRRQMLR